RPLKSQHPRHSPIFGRWTSRSSLAILTRRPGPLNPGGLRDIMTKSNVTPKRTLQASSSALPNDATVLCGRDKSLTHRAVMFAALARGETIIREPLLGA